MAKMMTWNGDAMAPRFRWRTTFMAASALAAATTLAPRTSGAQVVRDTAARTLRVQLRSGETTTVRLERISPARLRLRLDSLRQQFDGLESDAPERFKVERQIDDLIRMLAEHMARAARSARVDVELQDQLHGEIARSLAQAADGAKGMFRAHVFELPKGWIGINVEAPQTLEVRGDSAYVRYFTYPRIVSVEPNSPAEEVGIARGDRLVAYNGADVRGTPVNVTRLLRPENRLVVTVRRDGATRDFSITVKNAPQRFVARRQAVGGRVSGGGGVEVHPAPHAIIGSVEMPAIMPGQRMSENAPLAGANLTAIRTERMGRYFGVSSGILVTSVFGDPSAAAGLQEGDVILSADGRRVATVMDLRRLVEARQAERSIELSVVRHQEPLKIKLRW